MFDISLVTSLPALRLMRGPRKIRATSEHRTNFLLLFHKGGNVNAKS